ncbi:LysM peptidoglycan-binding domain-containing protein [Mycolicibacterium nivoides]|jgi:nucleoid-associated protein YgaU|uniref:LysM peptidoglycan-binding domain-containing protein n=2 Tax=Actinomycetes TaxID=1760 RepID=A0ABW9LFZ6_9MYCO|nr:LysM peptidoglycan-binding domain-containing protein [Mycolicibacterium nivoides]MBN3508269.1 LysM peptidoglycan-binding domain-containing protein [Mycolicibacterium septicum]SER88651.1 LysM domain-containing protein [Mycobacterium sp. 88mf]SFF49284.1 LysM domain-containing protein [Mycobacterium sp. 455mf]
MKNYTVALGDTLFGIAQREYGDGDLYPVIAEQNHLSNPGLINIGQELLIPYVTYRHLFTADDGTAARRQLTQSFYGTQSPDIQLIWEVVNGVAQREIRRGTWLLLPDLTNVGHHTVVEGESFVVLAARWYGDDNLAIVIANANNLDPSTDPDPGQVLMVPGLNRRRHIAGDTLESLCVEEYGDDDVSTRAAVAGAANYINRPHHLFSNQVVYFPS